MEAVEMDGKKVILTYLFHVILAFILSLVMIGFTAFLLYKTSVSAKMVTGAVVATYILSNLIAGVLIGKKMQKHQYLWGLLVGITYFAILFGASLVGNGFTVGELDQFALVFVLCAGSGMFGGMLS